MKYLNKQLEEKKGQIVWLASYPKSGNTWFRCFLSALFTGEIDLEKLRVGGIFSSRMFFDSVCNIDSRLLVDEEVMNMIPNVFVEIAKNADRLKFVKIHDAYLYNQLGNPIVPTEVTHKVIYLVRNPLDIVASLAHHNAVSIEETIKLMNNPKGYLAGYTEGLNINSQFRQLMLDWNGHVKSWVDQENIDVVLIRYEDMLHDSFNTFTKIVNAMGIKASKTAIQKAIRLTNFKKLQNKEQVKGFKEKNIRSESFFRSGKTGLFEKELSKEQINLIKSTHEEMMSRLNYL